MTDIRATSTKRAIRFDNDLLEAIQQAQGSDTFAGFIKDACRLKLECDAVSSCNRYTYGILEDD